MDGWKKKSCFQSRPEFPIKRRNEFIGHYQSTAGIPTHPTFHPSTLPIFHSAVLRELRDLLFKKPFCSDVQNLNRVQEMA